MTPDQNSLQQWVGRNRQERDIITLPPLQGMTALLDKDPAGISENAVLPPLWHWLFFLLHTRQSELAKDGHPHRGDFLPPVPLPRRMWAGGRLEFYRPLHVGDEVTRNSMIKNVDVKKGRSGPLIFVCVSHEISDQNGLAIYEEHDIVYRDKPTMDFGQSTGGGSRPSPSTRDYGKQHQADPVSLFRYSALTFNGHRIHYDRGYVTEQEGYPGLVVHGPLLATLLVDLLLEFQPEAQLQRFTFRAQHPVFDGRPFTASGSRTAPDRTELWIADHENNLCMKAMAEYLV